jgi:ATP-dependent exoDNAse (exonuclease V) beta subunit
MKSRIFYTRTYKEVEKGILALLNSQPDFLSARTAASTRAAGDAIQTILSEHFKSLLGEHCADYSAEFARRAMADLAFRDQDGLYYVVDVKTHRLETHSSGVTQNRPMRVT